MNLNDSNPKIILSSSLTNGRRFIKKQNINGVPMMNFSIYTPEMLVKEKIVKFKPGFRLIGKDESAYLLLVLIRKNNYKLKKYVTSFGAASKLLEVLEDYRYNENNNFTNLVPADYKNLVKDYLNELEKRNLIDYISALSLLLNNKQKEECSVLDDLYLRPLEEKVFKSMFDGFDNISFKEKDFNVTAIYKCYGQYNEVANLLDYVEENKIPTGDVEVIFTDSTYENIIKGLCSARGVPYTLKENHAKSSNLVSFICDVLNYFKKDYKYELLETVLSNQGLPSIYLKEFYKTLYFPYYVIGYSKERSKEFIRIYQTEEKPIEKAQKDFPNFLNLFIDILSITDGGFSYTKLLEIAKKYIQAQKEIEVLSNQLANLQLVIDLEDDEATKIDLAISLLEDLTYNEDDGDNKISFSKVKKSFTLRKYIFVLGCNQTFLTGSDIENAFIENVDNYQKELSNDKDIHTVLCQRNKTIDNLKYYLSQSDSDIYLSYSFYDKVNLKDMTEGFRLITSKDIPHTLINSYYIEKDPIQFKNNLGITPIGVEISFDNGQVNPVETIKPIENKEEVETNDIQDLTEKSVTKLSPSEVQILVECPFRFYYSKIMGLPEVSFPSLEETYWLEANARGTMFHEVMEFYFNNFIKAPIKKFDTKTFNKAFDEALFNAEKVNPISNKYIHDKEVEHLKDLAEKYLRRIIEEDNIFGKYLVLKNEYNLSFLEHIFKKNEKEYFKFTGVVDRVDGYVEDKVLHLRLFDYKSGSRKTKGQNPYYQHILYSYVIEQALPKNSFGLKYDSVIVDEFVYSFALHEGKEKKELLYSREEIDQNSADFNTVFYSINNVLIPFLDNEKNLLFKMNEEFVNRYPTPSENNKFYHGICAYCKFKKECAKRLEWGDKVW